MFTIGCDPEVFWTNKSELIAVVGKLGGTKEEPMPIGEGCAVQEDNVAAEFCVPPAQSAEAFIASIQYALSDIEARASALGLTLSSAASGVFAVEQLRSRQAQTFGCDPDYNAYTMKSNPRPKAKNKQLRSCGGHVHVGSDKSPIAIVRTLDLLTAVPSVLLDPDEDRRKLYGKAGCYRLKPYGVEYRTLSNFWIWSKETIEWVYHQVAKTVETCEEFVDKLSEEETAKIIHTINNNDKDMAKDLIRKYEVTLP